jgi:hypothetical protein
MCRKFLRGPEMFRCAKHTIFGEHTGENTFCYITHTEWAILELLPSCLW